MNQICSDEVFNKLYALAKEAQAQTAAPKMTQALAMQLHGGAAFCILAQFDQMEALVAQRLEDEQQTVVTHMLCMWENGQLDVPSMKLRTMLLERAEENGKTMLLLSGEDGMVERCLASTMPGKT